MVKKNYASCIALLAAAFAWGSAFLVIKDAVDAFDPFLLLAFRFVIAGVLLLLLCIPFLKYMSKKVFWHGLFMGIILYFEFLLFTIGIQYTSGSKSSFLLASYIVILPFVYWVVRKVRPSKTDFLSQFMCMAGTCFILLGGFDSINRGDIITIGSAFCYALHIVYTGKFAGADDPILLNLVQIGTGAILSMVCAVIFGEIDQLQTVTFGDFGSVFYLAIVCTILPYMLSVFGQKYVKTSTSGILLSFESVFGCICSVLAYKEKLSARFIIGAVLIVAAFFISNVQKEEHHIDDLMTH